MTKTPKNQNLKVVELEDGVLVCTSIPAENHAALRSGFARYTANPRWNAIKFRAWRIGRQWREALDEGTMTIRASDSMLVPTAEAQQETVEVPTPTKWFSWAYRLKFKDSLASMG
jgi:hypothetical protein